MKIVEVLAKKAGSTGSSSSFIPPELTMTAFVHFLDTNSSEVRDASEKDLPELKRKLTRFISSISEIEERLIAVDAVRHVSGGPMEIFVSVTLTPEMRNLRSISHRILRAIRTFCVAEKGLFTTVNRVVCWGVPSFPVSYDEIYFYPLRDETLANVHKVLSCRDLVIQNAAKIKGKVLGIVLIKDLTSFSAFPSTQWSKIIQKSVRDKQDVLGCQEELIAAGLKEFAKL
jgi:hypothetical protein